MKKMLLLLGILSSVSSSVLALELRGFGTRGSIDKHIQPFTPQTAEGFKQQTLFIPVALEPEVKNTEPKSDVGSISIEAWAGKTEISFQNSTKVVKSNSTLGRQQSGVRRGVKVPIPREKIAFITPKVPRQPNLVDQLIPKIDRQPETVDLNPANEPNKTAYIKYVPGTYENVHQLNRTPTNDPATQVAALPPKNTPETQGEIDRRSKAINATILFNSNSADIKTGTVKALETIANRMLKEPEIRLELLSFATGNKSRRLALTRALRVRKLLLDRGINSNRLIVKAKDSDISDRLDLKQIE